MFARILIPTDYSPNSEAALALARENFPEATRCLLHVLDPKRIAAALASTVSSKETREALEGEELARLEALAQQREECRVRVGTPAEIILQEADSWRADLIAMGTHGRTGLAHFMNGSVAEMVVRHARIPVLIEHEKKM